MKATQRLLAEVSRPRYLAVGRPTGLTGLLTHRSPRSTLIYVYSSTLEKLKRLPEWSVYRQATEKLTRHRLALVEQTVPQGLQDWEQRLQSQLKGREGLLDQQHFVRREELNGRHFVVARPRNIQHGANSTVAEQEADEAGEEEEAEHLTEDIEGQGREEEERQLDDLIEATQKAIDISGGAEQSLKLELEPQLTVDQITELENKIGAGLIEEVVQVAESEHQLVDVMVDAAVWEDLQDGAPEGQWKYHDRPTHTATQNP